MHNVQEVGVLIIGAGPTGIGAATDLNNAGYNDWLMIDSASGPGGMAMTEVDEQGFRWDLGGHVIHSHFSSFNKLALEKHLDWKHPNRSGWVRVCGRWYPTPIQKNLGSLVKGSEIARELPLTNSFEAEFATSLGEYYVKLFGPTLNKLFFAPFNEKQWAWPLCQLSHTWTSLRSGSTDRNVPVADASSVASIKRSPEDTSSFDYPRLGTGALWCDVAEKLPCDKQMYDTTVTKIGLEQQTVQLSTGKIVAFKRCISTTPLSSLIRLTTPTQTYLLRCADKLLSAETALVGFGFQGQLPEILSRKTWIFSADRNVPFHRASIPSPFSPDLADPGRWSILFETSISQHRQYSLEDLPDAHLAELRQWGIEAEPISIWKRHLKFGYPLPFLGRDSVLEELLTEVESFNILPRGRFGGWRYESSNQDYAFQQGIEAGQFVRCGAKESTFWQSRLSGPQYAPL